jgi:hypothetical protein
MMQRDDRRAAGVQRVAVERIVEICGREPGIPAFEAESVELSGRGMHVRTPYLPELGAPLVCRLEDEGREIVVEGVVAWRHHADDGGAFGVRFTALDSRSVDVLKTLCGLDADSLHEPATAKAEPEATEPSPPPPLASPGQPVKLHIEGLGSPMKARVQRGSKRRVHVGSNLEFLKVGRNLEIEDLGSSARLGATIDSVSVAVDPQTDVPQLVVTLRYEGVEDVTPEPSVLETAREASPAEPSAVTRNLPPPGPATHPAPPAHHGEPGADDDEGVEASDLDGDDDGNGDDGDADIDRFVQQSALRERLEHFAAVAARTARSTSTAVARASGAAALGVGKLAKQASHRVAQTRERHKKTARRRQSSTVAAAPLPAQARRLRPQSGGRRLEEEAGSANPRKKKIALATVGAGVLLAGAVLAFGGRGDPTPTAHPEATAETPPTANVVAPPAMKVVAAPGAEASPEAPRNAQGMIADVPLFGPTPMATMEPAPLEPPADDIEATDEDDIADERFEEPAPVKPSPKSAAAEPAERKAKPEEPARPTVWGTGRLHLPFVHRIKLDASGSGLEGAKKSNGFTVFLPNRKLLETGKAIARRDDRIVEVRTSNETRGARVTFVFQGQVPGYKVRLKGQYVEFFISAPPSR